ncbi:hypothetical protein SEA_MASELOP_56 [Rhodococcus phage Maselop]|nr:hypothetical protein SEA_BRAXOADDIE_56 [Rhodococcus phage Braxoaddie]WNM64979.1 hypothetical protein SEA_MASELOP_56 [Rhodococcus phage Maselop]WNM67440.1 hypothetical protein SEA_POLYYUKI_56 [Rhodococcus phage Polyyuki]
MRKLTSDDLKARLSATLDSISTDKDRGKLSDDPKTHPIKRVSPGGLELNRMLTADDLASLLAERMAMQGFVVYFDEALAREALTQALTRAEGILPR